MKSCPSSTVAPRAVSPPLGGLAASAKPAAADTAFRNHATPGLWLGALALLALVFVVYSAVLPGTFIMDDLRLVRSDNPLTNGQMTPATIWFQTDFPLSNLVFWLEWSAWGTNPFGYHILNLLLHALSAVLLWRLLAWLKIRGAWLAGAIFALHPVCVNSVTRAAELKNTLALPFFLLSIIFYLRYESTVLYPCHNSSSRAAGISFYTLSLLTFVLALFSKTAAVMVPVVLLACALWQRARLTRRDLLHTTPHFALALSFGLMSVWFQKYQALAQAGQTLPSSGWLERFALAGRVLWFYAGKALWPVNLNLIYPRWTVNTHSVSAYLPWLLVMAAAVFCWRMRAAWGRHVLFAVGCFTITLFPVLGFFDAQFMVRWQVSDHLEYLPLIGIVPLFAAALATLLKGKRYLVGAGVILLTCSTLANHRARIYASEELLMRDTLGKNPGASEAHNDLGTILAKRNQIRAALVEFAAAVRTDPKNAEAHLNLGQALAIVQDFPGAESQLRTAIQLKATDAAPHVQLAILLCKQARFAEARKQFQTALRLQPSAETHMQLAGMLYSSGEYGSAVASLRRALALNPKSPEALNNLAWLLATCADDQVRNGAEAVRCAELACELTRFKHSEFLSTLAAAYAEAGRFPDAVSMAEAALKLQTAAGQYDLAEINRQLLSLYRTGRPYHETGARTAQL